MFPEGSYEIVLSFRPSVHPSFHLSVNFLGIGSSVFLETFLGPDIVVCGRAGILGKNPQQAKTTKNGTKNRVFELLLIAFLGIIFLKLCAMKATKR